MIGYNSVGRVDAAGFGWIRRSRWVEPHSRVTGTSPVHVPGGAQAAATTVPKRRWMAGNGHLHPPERLVRSSVTPPTELNETFTCD